MAVESQMIWRQAQFVRTVEFEIPNNFVQHGIRFRRLKQIPVVAGGDSVNDIVGSIRGLAIRNGKLCGNLRWCSDAEAKAIQAKFDSGSLRMRLDSYESEVCVLRAGESLYGISGPNRLVLSWQPQAATLVGN